MPHTPVRTEPRERYWRRRANRRVRKARVARTLVQWTALLVINSVILGILGVSALSGIRKLMVSDRFALSHVELEGTERTTREEILGRLAPYIGGNLLQLDLESVETSVRENPWVLTAAVKRVLPNTLCIRVRERSPAALALVEGLAHVVDDEGRPIGPTGAGLSDDLPLVTGLDAFEAEEGDAALVRAVGMLGRLRRASPEFAESISELDVSRADRVVARSIDGGPELLLDPERVERNVVRYLALRPELRGRIGPLDYVDLRWEGRISVMPAMQAS
jgi:cell division protein FtsQ